MSRETTSAGKRCCAVGSAHAVGVAGDTLGGGEIGVLADVALDAAALVGSRHAMAILANLHGSTTSHGVNKADSGMVVGLMPTFKKWPKHVQWHNTCQRNIPPLLLLVCLQV